MLTGRPPFEATSPHEYIIHHSRDEYLNSPDLDRVTGSPALQTVLARALDRDRNKRRRLSARVRGLSHRRRAHSGRCGGADCGRADRPRCHDAHGTNETADAPVASSVTRFRGQSHSTRKLSRRKTTPGHKPASTDRDQNAALPFDDRSAGPVKRRVAGPPEMAAIRPQSSRTIPGATPRRSNVGLIIAITLACSSLFGALCRHRGLALLATPARARQQLRLRLRRQSRQPRRPSHRKLVSTSRLRMPYFVDNTASASTSGTVTTTMTPSSSTTLTNHVTDDDSCATVAPGAGGAAHQSKKLPNRSLSLFLRAP